jgi:hypothetical protein
MKQGHGESFEFTSMNISWVPTLCLVPLQVQKWVWKKVEISFVEIPMCYAMYQFCAGDLEVFSSIHFHSNPSKHHYHHYSWGSWGSGGLYDLLSHSSSDWWNRELNHVWLNQSPWCLNGPWHGTNEYMFHKKGWWGRRAWEIWGLSSSQGSEQVTNLSASETHPRWANTCLPRLLQRWKTIFRTTYKLPFLKETEDIFLQIKFLELAMDMN